MNKVILATILCLACSTASAQCYVNANGQRVCTFSRATPVRSVLKAPIEIVAPVTRSTVQGAKKAVSFSAKVARRPVRRIFRFRRCR